MSEGELPLNLFAYGKISVCRLFFMQSDVAEVDISVRDVNDRAPVFEKPVYLSSVPENAPLGTPVENVMATDADFGKSR